MLGFYVLLQDPDANDRTAVGTALQQWVFFISHRYIAHQRRPLATAEDAAANRRCWSTYNPHAGGVRPLCVYQI